MKKKKKPPHKAINLARTLVGFVIKVLWQTKVLQCQGVLEGGSGLLQQNLDSHLDTSVLACKILRSGELQ